MQNDFHHGITYIVARIAGFSHHDAGTIAYAAQYVDDATDEGVIHFSDGSTFECTATAHTKAPSISTLENNINNQLNEASWAYTDRDGVRSALRAEQHQGLCFVWCWAGGHDLEPASSGPRSKTATSTSRALDWQIYAIALVFLSNLSKID